ncbi:MAG: hypothetical protein KDA77_12290, partial [Planctomycetaceae bacterium]|nr:hypothetical protein [Planctomycetaceae bacterium]
MYGSFVPRTLLVGFSILSIVTLAVPLSAEKPGTTPPVDFEKSVRPLFTRYCQDCHGPDAREGGLRLTNRKNIL